MSGPPFGSDWRKVEEEDMNKSDESRTVKVTGITDYLIKMELLEMFFENERRSGGGDIEMFDVHGVFGTAFITFRERSMILKYITNVYKQDKSI